MKVLLKNGILLDPVREIEKRQDILIENGKISDIADDISEKDIDKIYDADKNYILPGCVDLHCHLREPGREDEETIETGMQSAAAGGFTHIVSMPNTNPVIDTSSDIHLIKKKCESLNIINLYPVAALSKNLEGKELSEMVDLFNAGAIGFSDDGNSVMNTWLMKNAFRYSKIIDCFITLHEEDTYLSGNGQVNAGIVATFMGLSGIPDISESNMIIRDIELLERYGKKLHIAHVSSTKSVDWIRFAKQKGLNITCEVTPHHIYFIDEDIKSFDTNLKVKPPIRTESDRKSLIKGLIDGTIDVIATDHAPHTEYEKQYVFIEAPFGIIGFETALMVTHKILVKENKMPLLDWVKLHTKKPADIINIDAGKIEKNKLADLTVFNPELEWEVNRDNIMSKSFNTPFIDKKVKGKIILTFSNGKKVYEYKS